MPKAQGAHTKRDNAARNGEHTSTTISAAHLKPQARVPLGRRHIAAIASGAILACLIVIATVLPPLMSQKSGRSVTAHPSIPVIGLSGTDMQLDGEATGTEDSETASIAATDEVLLDVPFISQFPELPNGCEITAATAMVDFYGFDASIEDLNGYLAQGWDTYDPHEEFIGTCESEGWMCYAEPIVNAINAYFADNGITHLAAVDITGTSAEALYDDYLAKGIPVTVWVTTYLQEREISDSWYLDDDEEVTVSVQDHCMTLIGYTADDVILMDPLDDIVEYPKEDFEASYESRGERAVVLKRV